MNQYRDFDNDQNTFSYSEGAQFLSKLHENGQHYIPIVDSAIYVPNPQNASDAYPTFDRGNETSCEKAKGEIWSIIQNSAKRTEICLKSARC